MRIEKLTNIGEILITIYEIVKGEIVKVSEGRSLVFWR